MANRFPLIVDSSALQIKELPASDNLDLASSGIVNASSISATSVTIVDSTVTGGINATGVITAASFSGTVATATNASGLTGTPSITVADITGIGANLTGVITATSGSFSGNISVGGTLTYEDVTNVDSLGIVTARNGLRVTQGGINVTAGISTLAATTATTLTASGALTASSTAVFSGGLVEKYENAGTTLGAQTNNPLSDGNVILFTGNESGTNTINFTGVHSVLSSGQAVSFTAILSPNGSGYINAVQVDGQAITPQWSGGSAPTGGGSSGRDVYNFTILKTGSGTSDYVILGALNNFA